MTAPTMPRANPALRWWRRLESIGLAETDSEDERVSKRTLTLIALLIAVLAFAWVGTYLLLDRARSALIPFGYQVATTASLVVFARTKSLRFLRATQLPMVLVLPFLLQWSLGGFARSSVVSLWAALVPSLSRFLGARAWPWLAGFVTLLGVSLVIDQPLADATLPLPAGVTAAFFGLNLAAVTLVVYAAVSYFVTERDRFRGALRRERDRSERLLLNVLPGPIAERLKRGETPIADDVPAVTVVFADIVGFTGRSTSMGAENVVRFLSDLFADLDDLAGEHGLVPIKTLGDGYMAVGGLFDQSADHIGAALELSLAMRDRVARRPFGSGSLAFRIGVDTGPAVAAVVGRRKFSYDLWGEAVNAASRMESHGLPGEIQVTARVESAARDRFVFEHRGIIPIKGLGEMDTYLLKGRGTGGVSPP